MTKKYIYFGASGLKNMGNTCYMNSILQIFAQTPHLASYMVSNDISSEHGVSSKINNIIKLLWTEKQLIICPRKFKQAIGIKSALYAGHEQNDSQEFMNFLFDMIHEELGIKVKVNFNFSQKELEFINMSKKYKDVKKQNVPDIIKKQALLKLINYRKYNLQIYKNVKCKNYEKKLLEKKYSIINKIFSGIFMTETVCKKCNNINIRFEHFNILQLPLKDTRKQTLEECIDEFNKNEEMTGDNMFKCNICESKQECLRKISICKFPEILIIQLKRFGYKNENGVFSIFKKSAIVDFPINNLKMGNCEYDLYATNDHMGSLNSGHYTSNCKNIMNGLWYSYDDEAVSYIEDEFVENHLKTSKAYILCYVKKH